MHQRANVGLFLLHVQRNPQDSAFQQHKDGIGLPAFAFEQKRRARQVSDGGRYIFHC